MDIKANNFNITQDLARIAHQDNVLKNQGTAATDAQKIGKLSEDFEALFLEIVLKSMRNTVQKSSLIDGGNAEDIYRTMLDSEYAKLMSHQRSSGLANAIEEHLLKLIDKTKEEMKKVDVSQGLKVYQSQTLRDGVKQAKIISSGKL